MKSKALRERIGLSRSEWARALNVSEITVKRWEDDGRDPSGLADEVMRGISTALEEGVNPKHVGRMVGMGIGALLFYGLRG